MRGIAPGEAALYAGMPVVCLAVLPGHHADHRIALHLGLEVAADAAIGAGGDDGMFRLTQFDHRLLKQRSGRAGLHAGAAGDAFRGQEFLAGPAATFDSKPRPSMVRANVFCTSSHARTQREQTMQRAGSNWKYGLDASISECRWFMPFCRNAPGARRSAQPSPGIRFARPASHAVQWMIGEIQFHHAAAHAAHALARGGHLHAGRHRRGTGCRCASAALDLEQAHATRRRMHPAMVAQSFGILIPASIAACMIDVPAGTVTSCPSMVSVTCSVAVLSGVP